MGGMQDKIMASLRLIASGTGLEFVDQAERCDTGIVYLQRGFDTVAEIAYCFLSGYCTITFRGPALSAAGLPFVPSAKSAGEDGLAWHYLAYGNGGDIRAMLAVVECALAAAGNCGQQAALSVQDDPAAPAWVRGWRGPFNIRISRELAEGGAVPGVYEAILAAGAAAVEAGDAAEEAAARHADARCRVAALIAASLLPAASSVVFDREEDTVTAETEITVVIVRDSDGRLLWYKPGTGYADHPDAMTLGEPPALYPDDLADMQHQIRAAYDAHPGHFETAGEDIMPSANLLVLPVPYPG